MVGVAEVVEEIAADEGTLVPVLKENPHNKRRPDPLPLRKLYYYHTLPLPVVAPLPACI